MRGEERSQECVFCYPEALSFAWTRLVVSPYVILYPRVFTNGRSEESDRGYVRQDWMRHGRPSASPALACLPACMRGVGR